MSTTHAFEQVQLAAQLADLKQEHYQTLLTLNGLIALLTNKGIINDRELTRMIQRIDQTLEQLIAELSHPKALADQQK